MSGKKIEDKLRKLEKENSSLKKKLSKYRKKVIKSDLYSSPSSENDDLIAEDTNLSKKIVCERCGNDEVRELKILSFVYNICESCKYRKKIKNKNKNKK